MFTIPESFYFYINFIVAGIYLFFFISGYRRGFLLSMITLIGSAVSFFAAWRYSALGNEYYHFVTRNWLPMQDTVFADQVYIFANQIAWFLILYLVLKFLFYLAGKVVEGAQKLPVIKQISGLLGGLLGIFIATFWILSFCVVLNTPLFANGRELKDSSCLHVIAETSEAAFGNVGMPLSSTDAINKLYTDARSLSDDDIRVIEEWLDSHGFDRLPDYTGGKG